MAFIVKKNINGHDYFYLNENKRVEGKVKTKTIAYLGKSRSEAERKMNDVLSERERNKGFSPSSSTTSRNSARDIDNPDYSLPRNHSPASDSIDNTEKGNEEKTTNNVKYNRMKDESKMKNPEISIDEMAAFCKRKGFVYPSADIYGGFAGFWDFGPLGVEMKNNLKKAWWDFHVHQREDVTGIDGSIITSPKVWEASGHVESFVDVEVVDRKTGEVSKVDKFEVQELREKGTHEIKGEFNPMFRTIVGPGSSNNVEAYLRPETAQLIFTNFKNVYDNSRAKLPFGIAQQGKAFRNEIAPRNFLFRSREFEQMEIEFFIKPGQKCPYQIPDEEVLVLSADSQEKDPDSEGTKMKIKDAFEKGIIKKDWHAYWLAIELKWFKSLGANPDNFRLRQHMKDELAHYSSDCWDLEYNFPFGWKELEGIADRKDYDLLQHEKFSKKDLRVFDEETKEKILPYVVCEPSIGVERSFLVFMFDSYKQRDENIVLSMSPKLSPIKAAVFPIVKKEEYEKISQDVMNDLKKEFNVVYDRSGSIGRRYARNDESGTPYCITVDEDSLKNNDVTIRDRDTTKQIRVKTKELRGVLRMLIEKEINFEDAGKPIN